MTLYLCFTLYNMKKEMVRHGRLQKGKILFSIHEIANLKYIEVTKKHLNHIQQNNISNLDIGYK